MQFWALPGGLVVPGVLLGLLMLHAARRGATLPRFVGVVLIAWALVCVWMVGPSGFMTLLVPGTLLLMAGFRRGVAAGPTVCRYCLAWRRASSDPGGRPVDLRL